MFYPLDALTSTILVVHPSVVEDNITLYDTLANGDFVDGRARNKFYKRAEPATSATICSSWPGEFQDLRWITNVDPTPFIRNEELILLYAEANWLASGGDKNESIRALNNVRNTWGVGDTPINTVSSDDEFIEELLEQRRFSLWAETGHRWVDLRRFNRLDDTHIDLRDCGSIYTQVDRRTSEQTWEDSNN